MQQLTIVDGNNWFRRRAETDVLGTPVHGCFNEMQFKPGLVVVVWDGRGALERRRFIYPEYKVHRTPPPENIYESQRLLKNVLKLSKVIQVQVDGYEGDDVIAALAERYREGFSKVFIESNDVDLYQLGLPMSKDKFPEAPKWIRLYKTFVGDSSDNIKGAKGFGKGAWAALTEEHKTILESIIVSGWGLTDNEVEEKVKTFYPKSALQWFKLKENRKQLQIYYKIIGFIYIPWPEIEKNMIAGSNRPDLAQPIFEEFHI